MIKLKELISEVRFTKPNFDYEWEEAERYPKLFPDKQTWLDAVKSGIEVEVDCDINIQITDMCESDVDLEPAKVDRVQKMIESDNIELPICPSMPPDRAIRPSEYSSNHLKIESAYICCPLF